MKNSGSMIHSFVNRRTILSCLLVVALVFAGSTLFRVTASAATSVDTFAELKAACQTSGTVQITSKIAVTDTIVIPSGVTVYLTCTHDAGSTTTDIYRAQSFHGHLFKVNDGATLYVRCAIDGNNKDGSGNLRGTGATGTESTGYYGQALILNYGHVVMDNDKSVMKNNYNAYNNSYTAGLLWTYNSVKYYGLSSSPESTSLAGSAMLCVNGKFTMSNGQIYGCYSDNGPAIYVCNGYAGDVVKISGGKIHDNVARRYGGAIFAASRKPYDAYDNSSSFVGSRTLNSTGSNALVTVSGGSIYKNLARLNSGAVWTGFGGTFYMSGGSIYNNVAVEEGGGGIRVNAGGSGTTGGWMCFANPGGQAWIAGGSIYGNTCATNGGGITVPDNDDSNNLLKITGGNIYSNKAGSNGGGVYVASKLTMSGGKIYSNTANGSTSKGGGVYLTASSTGTISGGSVYNNTAVDNGGGVSSYGTLTVSGGLYYGNTPFGVSFLNKGTVSGGRFGVSAYTNYSEYTVSRNGTGQIHVGSSATVTIKGGTSRVVTTLASGEGVGGNSGIRNYGTLTVDATCNADNGYMDIYGTGIGIYNTGTLKVNGKMNIMTSAKDGSVVQTRRGIYNTGTVTVSGELSIRQCGNNGVYNTGTYTMSAGSIYGNEASAYGGAVFNPGTFNLKGGAIYNNSAGTNGGGIYNICSEGSAGKFTMSGGSIYGNTAGSHGGGVYFTTDGEACTISGGEIYSNTAAYGGGISSYRTNGITLSNVSVYNNTATETGGGIRSNNGKLTINSGFYYGNNSVGVYAAAGTLVINGGKYGVSSYTDYSTYTVSRNITSQITVGSSAVATINTTNGPRVISTIVDDESVAGNYGLINYGTVTVTNTSTNPLDFYGTGTSIYNSGTLTVNGVVKIISSSKDGTTTVQNRRGIYNIGTVTASGTLSIRYCGVRAVYNTGTFTMSGGNMYGNESTASGGAVYNLGTFTLKGGSIYNNTAATNGGAIYNISSDGSAGKFTMSGGSIYGNTAGSHGGGVYFTTDGEACAISGGSIYDNEAAKYGGGICSYRESGLTISGSAKIYSNSGTHGGGVFTSTGALTFSGTIGPDNTATYGGGIYAGAGIKITGGTIDGNSATQKAGGIYAASSTTVTMTAGTISNNFGRYYGGGIYTAGTLVMSGSAKFDGNSTEQFGGGICGEGGTLTLSGGSIVNNSADVEGGGVYVDGTITLSGVSITNNTAIHGAGLHVEAGTGTMSAGTISNNTAQNYGGGIHIEDGTFDFTGGSISNNKATSYLARGGGVFNDGTFTMTGGTINGNSVPFKTAESNGIETYGGGLFTNGDYTIVNIKGGSIYDNSAICGAGVCVYAGTTTVSGGKIYNNTAELNGGGFQNWGNLYVTGGEIYGNTAVDGSGIYNMNTRMVYMSQDASVDEENEVFLDGWSYITVPAEFSYDGLVAMVDCDHKEAGRVIAKSAYGDEVGSELLYYSGSSQRFELTFEQTESGEAAFLRGGDQGAASDASSGVSDEDVFISVKYVISFDGNLAGYSVTVPDSIVKYWFETVNNASVADAYTDADVFAFKVWNTASDGSGTDYVSPITYSENAHLVLYAQWTSLGIFEIDYVGNGATSGSGWTEVVDMSVSSIYNLSNNENAFARAETDANGVKTRYGFIGWTFDGDFYDFGAEVSMTDLYSSASTVAGRDHKVVTIYAYWDEFPVINAIDRWFTLDDAQTGKITLEELMKTAEAIDGDVGDPTDFANGEGTFTIIDYSAEDFKKFTTSGSVTVRYIAVDKVGNETERVVTVHLVDKYQVIDLYSVRFIRFLSSKFYKTESGSFVDESQGGVHAFSVWRISAEYEDLLTDVFSNKQDATTGEWETVYQTWVLSKEQIREVKEFVEEHGLGNTQSEDALEEFYRKFYTGE